MPDTVIKAENIGKVYTIGHQKETERYTALRDVIMQNSRALWNKTRDLLTGKPIIQGDTMEEVWALREINFEIHRGEAIGIIGRNGAGKSTLLKVLSRITEPSTGRLTIKGHVASLLEVGTGFHPELTGRENIFLNGTILGMTRREIKTKFDEIVDFAEVEKFLDTPVKRYSSGMYVRLAFAVAAHLEPEILVVDEVLAVGDAQFQKKCLGKMNDVAKGGRTVLFVSHNMAAIENLCKLTMWIDGGKIKNFGVTRQIVTEYISMFLYDQESIDLENFKDRSGTGEARIVRIDYLNNENKPCSSVRMGEKLTIKLTIRSEITRRDFILGLYLFTEDGQMVTTFKSHSEETELNLNKGLNFFELIIDSVLLYPRAYIISPWIVQSKTDIDFVRYAAKITVKSSSFITDGIQFEQESLSIAYVPYVWKKVESN